MKFTSFCLVVGLCVGDVRAAIRLHRKNINDAEMILLPVGTKHSELAPEIRRMLGTGGGYDYGYYESCMECECPPPSDGESSNGSAKSAGSAKSSGSAKGATSTDSAGTAKSATSPKGSRQLGTGSQDRHCECLDKCTAPDVSCWDVHCVHLLFTPTLTMPTLLQLYRYRTGR